MTATTHQSLSCDAKKVPGWEWRQEECAATFGPRAGTKAEVREEAKGDEGWSRVGKFDLCPEHSCPYDFAHTRDWCRRPFCREA